MSESIEELKIGDVVKVSAGPVEGTDLFLSRRVHGVVHDKDVTSGYLDVLLAEVPVSNVGLPTGQRQWWFPDDRLTKVDD